MIDLENQHRESLRDRRDSGISSRSRDLGDSGDSGSQLIEPPRPSPSPPSPSPPSASFGPDPGPPYGRARAPGTPPRQAPERTDPRDLMPTIPRPMSQPMQVARFPTPLPVPPPAPRGTQARAKKKSAVRPWLLIVAILLAAAVAGVVVGMSGPDVAVQHGK